MQMIPGDPFSLSTSIGGFAQSQSQQQNTNTNPNPKPNPPPAKKKRNLPGTPDPDAEVIALSPKALMATNRFICEICNKGFQRDQNLQLHRRGHNLPWKLRQRSNKEVVRKKVYICPEKTCVHHDPARALGDLTGIKKHFSRKHGEKKWKCDKCSKKYAVQSDWKAHTKTCGTREYKCDCGTLFSRKDSFITHRAFCDALAEESARMTSVASTNLNFKSEESVINSQPGLAHEYPGQGFQNMAGVPQFGFNGIGMGGEHQRPSFSLWLNQGNPQMNPLDVGPTSGLYVSSSSSGLPEIVKMGQAHSFASSSLSNFGIPPSNSANANLSLSSLPIGKKGDAGGNGSLSSMYSEGQNKQSKPPSPMSATALLQKAAQMGSTRSSSTASMFSGSFGVMSSTTTQASASLNASVNQDQAFQNQGMKQPAESFASSGSTAAGAAMLGNSNFSSLTHTLNSFDQLLMQSNGKQGDQVRLKLHHCSNAVEDHALTRDFLGVSGGRGAGPPFLPEELANFASLGSTMGLSQFTANQ